MGVSHYINQSIFSTTLHTFKHWQRSRLKTNFYYQIYDFNYPVIVHFSFPSSTIRVAPAYRVFPSQFMRQLITSNRTSYGWHLMMQLTLMRYLCIGWPRICCNNNWVNCFSIRTFVYVTLYLFLFTIGPMQGATSLTKFLGCLISVYKMY